MSGPAPHEPRGGGGILVVLAGLVVAAVLLGLLLGAVPVDPAEVLDVVRRGLAGRTTPEDALVWQLRLPRVLLAGVVGACLAGAGALYQALFRNPLADPFILGISSGAGLAAAVALAGGVAFLGPMTVPLAAFAGALITLVVLVGVATRNGVMDSTSLLLSGVALSYTLAALTSFVMVFAQETMTEVVFWMMGGLSGASWAKLGAVTPMLAAGVFLPLVFRRELDLLLLGEERAGQLGVAVERVKMLTLGSASLLVAAAVAVSGLIGFVGLMVPHAVRLVVGPGHRLLLPASILAGAVAMILADVAARVLLAPVELPVGIVTALLGGPFFVWLLVRGRRVAV